MKERGLLSRKVTPLTALVLVVVLAIPAFFWFRFLYSTYVVDRVSPQMQKMRDAIMKPHPMPGVPTPGHPQGSAPKKGDKAPTH